MQELAEAVSGVWEPNMPEGSVNRSGVVSLFFRLPEMQLCLART